MQQWKGEWTIPAGLLGAFASGSATVTAADSNIAVLAIREQALRETLNSSLADATLKSLSCHVQVSHISPA